MPKGFHELEAKLERPKKINHLCLSLERERGLAVVTCKLTMPNGKGLGGGNLFSIMEDGTISRMGGITGAVVDYGLRLNGRGKIMLAEERQ